MDYHKSRAIIMRIREFGESDLLVSFFSEQKGQLKGVAKGGRRSRKRFVNCLDHFCLVDLEYGSKKSGDLHLLHSGRLIHAYPGLRSDFEKLSRASYMVELTEVLFPYDVADQAMFRLLNRSFELLETGACPTDLVAIFFEIRAMTLGGYGINVEKCCQCGRRYRGQGKAAFRPEKGGIACLKCREVSAATPGMEPDTVKTIQVLRSGSSVPLDEMPVSEDIIRELKPVLRLHREYHLGRRLKTSAYMD
jgi:DNA repair protein RecO (recombination protein O)